MSHSDDGGPLGPLFEHSPLPQWIFERGTMRFLRVNDAAVHQYGHSRAEFMAMTLRDIRPPEEIPRLEGLVAESGRVPGTFTHLRRDGARVKVEVATQPLAFEGRNAVHVTVVDVSERERATAAVRESEERYRMIVEGARDYAILTLDDDGVIESWSPGAEAVLGWSAAEAVGRNVAMTFTPEDQAAGVPGRERAVARERGWAEDVRWHQRCDGTRVFISGMARVLESGVPGGSRFLKIGQDVTERRATEEALKEREAHLEAMFAQATVGLAELTLDGRFIRANDALCTLIGRPREEVVGRSLAEVTHPDDVAPGVRAVAEATRTGRTATLDTRYLRPDGAVVWVNSGVSLLREAGRAKSLLAVTVDLTLRRRAEALLRDLNRELEERVAERTAALERANDVLTGEVRQRVEAEDARREALRQLVTAEEVERRRISRELHDTLGQRVTGLLLGLRALRSDPGDAARVTDLERLAGLVAHDMHHLAVELRPPALDNLGLVPAARSHLDEWSRRFGVACDFHAGGMDGARLPAEVETTIYRVLQEGLNNVAKHAGATRVGVVLERRGGSLQMILEDDGRGFPVDEAGAAPRPTHRLGLLGMRERVGLVGGELEIESRPGSGTTLFVRLPAAALQRGGEG